MAPTKISRRDMLKALGLASAGAALAACGTTPTVPTTSATQAPVAAGEAPAPTTAPAAADAGKKYKILHWAQGPEPTDPNAVLEAGQTRRVAYQLIADQYMKEHPDVEIEWYRFPAGSNVQEWLLARMTAQDAPDIYWANTEDLWPHINKNWALDFTEYMNMPNPYVSGNTAWKDQFQDVAIFSQTGPDGKLYGVNMDGAGVLIVYNQQAFTEAGIESVPKTWTEFIDAQKKLQAKGYIPFGANLNPDTCCYPHWAMAHLYNQLTYNTILTIDDDKNQVITAKEVAQHAQKGDALDWDAYLKVAHLLKEWSQFFPVGYEGTTDYRQLFRQGKVAMYMEGNWAISEFQSSPTPFEINWTAFPVITKDIWPQSTENVVRIQGAWGGMQYHVPGYLKEKEPDKIPIIMDWLMFSSKPENVTNCLKETSMVSLTKGAEAVPELAPFNQPYDRAVPYQSWQTLSSSGLQAEYKLWQAYLPSSMSDQEFIDKAKKDFDAEVQKVLEANPDWKV